jgi:HJR/Mrr/RecB family endonuclease
MAEFKVYRAEHPPTTSDIRELREFLASPLIEDEKELQRLLEKHPALVGVLGFTDFVSEFPLFKTNAQNLPELRDRRRRDRADLIAASTSPILSSYRAANIIELKSAAKLIADRSVGFRPSAEAAEAIAQLHEYRHWLTTIPENRNAMAALKWDVRWPALSLIMGSDQEFIERPGQLEEFKSRMVDQGIRLFTMDDVLRTAMRHVDERILPPQVADWYFDRVGGTTKRHSIQFLGSIVDNFQTVFDLVLRDPTSLANMPYRVFEELVAEIYSRMGYTVELTPLTRDGGIDIIASRDFDGAGVRLMVECKLRRTDRKVGIAEVRALYGVKISEQATKAILVTTGSLTQEARAFIASRQDEIQAYDMNALLSLIATVRDRARRNSAKTLEIHLREDGLAPFEDIVSAGRRYVLEHLSRNAEASESDLFRAAVDGIDWEFPVKVVDHERGWEAAHLAVQQGQAVFREINK